MSVRLQGRMVGRCATVALIVIWTLLAGELAAQRVRPMANPFKSGAARKAIVAKNDRAPALDHKAQARSAQTRSLQCGNAESLVLPITGPSLIPAAGVPLALPYEVEQRDPRRLQRSTFHIATIVASYFGVSCINTMGIVTSR
jgi:hypothetical protein